ncbi:hypothetical protein BT96DRAFT_917613 [Gymnopus androsaceus JB14]|uniref:Uncharacterized protein n=1 Tax=Gymnopus androsaceus JB14 TaxID=1447944 RepID=A0A6A4I3A0_9AGAR|nr:hypothetical protein BT96DRAFT_917613 [Gymnopus androsaceus JB14]
MTFTQVASLLQSLSSPGSVSASKLPQELVDLLAEMVPKLEELELRIKDVVPLYTYPSSRKSRSQCREQIDQFSTEMHSRTYTQWTNLKRVSVWKFNSKMQYQAEYVELFGECVPALKRELEKGRRRRSQDGGGEVLLAQPQQCTSAGVITLR